MKKQRSGLGLLASAATVVSALGTLAVIIVCLFMGFGIHTFEGLLTLYLSLGLQILNLLALLLRRHAVLRCFTAPPPSRKMRNFRNISIFFWCFSVVMLLAALPLDLLWLGSLHPAVRCLRIAGGILSPLSWVCMLAAYYRRRQATFLSQK